MCVTKSKFGKNMTFESVLKESYSFQRNSEVLHLPLECALLLYTAIFLPFLFLSI